MVNWGLYKARHSTGRGQSPLAPRCHNPRTSNTRWQSTGEFFRYFGLIVYDEVHQIGAPVFSLYLRLPSMETESDSRLPFREKTVWTLFTATTSASRSTRT